MAVINCPECKEKMSDTLNACPHCGFKIKVKKDKILKKKKNFREMVKGIIEWIKNNKKKSAIIGGIVLAILLILYLVMFYISLEPKRVAEEAVAYLEDEGFNCILVDSYEEWDELFEEKAYVCKKTDGTVTHEYRITFGDRMTMSFRINDFDDSFIVKYTYKEFDVTFDVWDFNFIDSMGIKIESDETSARYYFVNDDLRNGVYVPNECSEDYRETTQKRCELLKAYKNEVNESIKMFVDLYDELDIELR